MRPYNKNTVSAPTADSEVVSENIRNLHHRFCRLTECSLLHIGDLHRSISDNTTEEQRGDLHSLFLEHRPEKSDLPFSPLPESTATVQMMYRSLGTAERVAFCTALAKDSTKQSASELAAHLFGNAEAPDGSAMGKVAYQQNIFADEAFLRFSPDIFSPKAAYLNSFSGVCEQVYHGESEYCILPLENSQDGKLLRFYSLIEKYELKIVLTCDVTASDQRQTTTFGLCRRSLYSEKSSLRDQHTITTLELIFWQDDEYPALHDILCAAQACSLHLIRVDCLPRSDDEIMVGADYPFLFSFDVQSGDIRTFLHFLAMDAPSCLPLGLYRQK